MGVPRVPRSHLSPSGLSALMRGCSVTPVSCPRSCELGLEAVRLIMELEVSFFLSKPLSRAHGRVDTAGPLTAKGSQPSTLHSGLPALTMPQGCPLSAAPSSPSRSQEFGLGVSFRAGEALSGVGAEGPQGPLKASSQSLTAKRYRSLSEPSRACSRSCVRADPKGLRISPRSSEELRAGRESLLRAPPKLPELAHALVFRK